MHFVSGVASSAVEVEVPEGAEASLVTPSTTSHAQYSPSISHDEEERENMEEGEGGRGEGGGREGEQGERKRE